jgi:hypothetical protein
MNFHFDLHVSKETTYPNSRYIESNTGGGGYKIGKSPTPEGKILNIL